MIHGNAWKWLSACRNTLLVHWKRLRQWLKWTGKPWAPLLTCLGATQRLAAEASRYQSPGFCQRRRHATYHRMLLVDVDDWSFACLSVAISWRKARWLLLKWAGIGRSLLSPRRVGGRVGEVWDCSPPTWLCNLALCCSGHVPVLFGNCVWCFLRVCKYICLLTR